MNQRLGFILILIVLLIVVSPVSLVIIQGDSMEPTVPKHSVLITYETQSPSVGDIITFQSQDVDTKITHRAIEKQDGKFITKGDNNRVTDQRTGEPLVPPENIENTAVVVLGQPLYIPYIGQLFTILKLNIFAVVAGGGAVFLALQAIRSRAEQNRVFGHLIASDIFQPIFLVTAVVLSLVFLLSASTLTPAITYTDNPNVANQQYVVQTNTNSSVVETVTVQHSSTKYTSLVYTAETVEIKSIEEISRNQTNLELIIPSSNTTGKLETTITIYKFPSIYPQSVFAQLTDITPALPALLVSLTVITPFYIWYRLIIGPKTPIHSLFGDKITRWLNK